MATAEIYEAPLDRIDPSPYNRKHFNEAALDELAKSIKSTDGVIEPVVLRPVGQRLQLVAGERRWLASKRAGRTTVKAIVRPLTDAQAIEWTLQENGQREDVPAVELARTYKALLGQVDSESGKPYSRELISERVSKSYSVVCAILQTENLIPEVAKANAAGVINDSLAMEIAKYTLPQQAEIYLECFQGDGYREYDGLKALAKDKEAEAGISLRRLREYIAHNIHIELAKAPFDVKDGFLLKGVPSCDKCPKRTGNQPGLFDGVQEVKKGDTCTDPSCYQAKEEAFVELKAIEASKPVEQPKHATKEHPVVTVGLKTAGADLSQSAALKKEKAPAAPVVEVKKISIEHYHGQDESRKKGVLYPDEYNLAKPGCKKEVKAILVDGPKIGQVEFICDIKGCSNHGYTGSSSPRDPVTFERKVQIWNQKVLFVYRDAVLKAVMQKIPGQIEGQIESGILLRHLCKNLPHQAVDKIMRVYEQGNKASLESFVKQLSGAKLFKFLLVASLVEDLGVDDLAWEREEGGLTKVAESYKVDTKKLLAEAKAELEKKRPKSDKEKEAEAKKDTAEVVKAHGKKVVKDAKKVMAKGKGKK